MKTVENNGFVYEFGNFVLDPNERTLFADGQPVQMPAKEFETLLLLVENNGKALSKDQMMDTLWEGSFVEESNLPKQISRLRKLFNTNGEVIIETLPKHGYRFSADLRRVSPALNDSDVIERTIRNKVTVKLTDDGTARGLPEPTRRVFTRNRVIAVVLIAAVGIGAFWFWRQRAAPPQDITTIAVLPFKMLDPREEDDYLGLGMTDALITKLSNVHQLAVRPTSSVRKYLGGEQNISEAGRELEVGAVLQGSIQRADDKIRITVQLVRVADGASLWADSFDNRFTDILSVQDSISTEVAKALQLKLTTEEQKGLVSRYTNNPEAYQAYLMGRYFWNKRTTDGFKKAISNFEQAIERDNNYALAYVGMADSYILIGYFGGLPMTDAMPKAKQAATKALSLDESIAEAHASLGNINAWYEWDRAAAENEFRRAIELNPNYPTAHHWYGLFLAATRRFDEAIEEMKVAQSLDPTSLIINSDLGYAYYLARRYDQAIEQCKKTLEMDPGFEIAHYEAGLAYVEKGEYDKALSEFQIAASLDDKPQTMAMIGYTHAKAGNRKAAEKTLQEIKNLAKLRFIAPSEMVNIHTALGDADQAIQSLEKDYELRSSNIFEIGVDPRLDALRSDVRFQNLLSRVGVEQ